MERSEFQAFKNMIEHMCFVHNRDSSKLVDVYWATLMDLDFARVRSAVLTALRECEYMPTPARIRRHCGATVDMRIDIAWSAVLEAAARVGRYKSVVFDDVATTASVRALGGWMRICAATTEEAYGPLRKSFAETYARIIARGLNEQDAQPLGESSDGPVIWSVGLKKLPIRVFLEQRSDAMAKLAETQSHDAARTPVLLPVAPRCGSETNTDKGQEPETAQGPILVETDEARNERMAEGAKRAREIIDGLTRLKSMPDSDRVSDVL